MHVFHLLGRPSVSFFSCVDLSQINGAVNVTVNWTLSGGDSANFYLISITTNASQTPYGGLLNITGSVTQYELTSFMAGYEYNITVRGVNCGGQEGRESEPLTIRPQGTDMHLEHCTISICLMPKRHCISACSEAAGPCVVSKNRLGMEKMHFK